MTDTDFADDLALLANAKSELNRLDQTVGYTGHHGKARKT